MSPQEIEVKERLQLFYRVQLDGGTERDAMWAVLAADRAVVRAARAARAARERETHVQAAIDIVDRVCREMGVERALLVALRRGKPSVLKRHLVRARWVASQVLRSHHYSLLQIAEALGYRGHQQVLHGLRRLHQHPDLVNLALQIQDRALAA